MDNIEKKCKKCKRILPEGYKHKYCENCRNENVQVAKNVGKGILGAVGSVACLAALVVTICALTEKGFNTGFKVYLCALRI